MNNSKHSPLTKKDRFQYGFHPILLIRILCIFGRRLGYLLQFSFVKQTIFNKIGNSYLLKYSKNQSKSKKIFLLLFFIFNIWFWFFSLPRPLFQTDNSALLLDQNNNLLGATIAKDEQWRFPKNDSVPAKFATCITQFEDAYFYKHPGFNPVSLFRALVQNIRSRQVVSGASTITMQTIRLAKGNPKRTYTQKALEIIQAMRLELALSKEEILLEYASNAPFGGNVVGIDAAAWRYFGKTPQQLSWAESATLAVLPNAPSLIFPGKNEQQLLNKRNRLLKKLLDENLIQKLDYELALTEPLPQKPNALPQIAPHFLHFLDKKNNHKRFKSTVDIQLQNRLNQIVKNFQRSYALEEINNMAALIVEVETGAIKAYVGNTTERNNPHENFVDMIQAERSSGSILKPFLYAKMLESGELLPRMLLTDTPLDITENYSKTYQGVVPANEALAQSLNIPAVSMLRRHGVVRFKDELQEMGLSTLHYNADHYGLSLIVGGAEVKLWELAQTYRNMAYRCLHPSQEKFQTQLKTETDEVINSQKTFPMSSSAAYLTLEAMSDVARPSSESGWTLLNNQKIAWKTGTSHGFKDAWAVGVTPRYVVAVWVGNADGEGRPGLVGAYKAGPLLFDILGILPSGDWFERPKTEWLKVKTCQKSGYLFGQYCADIKEELLPKFSENAPACPFHQIVHLDSTETYRVNSSCYPVAKSVTQKRFVLEPLQAYYYKNKNPWYKDLPAFEQGCSTDEKQPIQFVYPINFNKILIPKAFDDQQKVVFQVVHKNPAATLHWFLNNEFKGTTHGEHKLALNPSPGSYVLTLSDDQGNRLQKKIQILE